MREHLCVVDGRGNAGPQGACAAVLYQELVELDKEAKLLGEVSNNVAEYRAVKLGMELARKHGIDDLKINSDSQLIVNQIKGIWKVNEKSAHLRVHRDEALAIGQSFSSLTIEWVSREHTSVPDKMCRAICKEHFG